MYVFIYIYIYKVVISEYLFVISLWLSPNYNEAHRFFLCYNYDEVIAVFVVLSLRWNPRFGFALIAMMSPFWL